MIIFSVLQFQSYSLSKQTNKQNTTQKNPGSIASIDRIVTYANKKECSQRERGSLRGEFHLRHDPKNNNKISFFSICGSICHVSNMLRPS